MPLPPKEQRLPGYHYFTRSHQINRDDPVVQEIIRHYRNTHLGAEPKDGPIRHILWRVLHERHRWPTLDAALSDWYSGPVKPPKPGEKGLRHSWKRARGTWLYPGHRDVWLSSQRMMTWTMGQIDAYLSTPEVVKHSTHVVICCSTGRRHHMLEKPFNALKHEDHLRRVFQKVIDADKAPVAWLMSQEFFTQELRGNHRKLLEQLEHTAALVQDMASFCVPMRELGEIYGGGQLKKRNEMFQAMRKGAPKLPLACHERPMTEITVKDFRGVSGDVISLLQCGFWSPTGGMGREQDSISVGRHNYDGCADLVRRNNERMSKWQSKGHMERHTNAVGEHSIPFVFTGQPWQPTRDLGDAQRRGRRLLKAGAAFDLNSGATLD